MAICQKCADAKSQWPIIEMPGIMVTATCQSNASDAVLVQLLREKISDLMSGRGGSARNAGSGRQKNEKGVMQLQKSAIKSMRYYHFPVAM